MRRALDEDGRAGEEACKRADEGTPREHVTAADVRVVPYVRGVVAALPARGRAANESELASVDRAARTRGTGGGSPRKWQHERGRSGGLQHLPARLPLREPPC